MIRESYLIQIKTKKIVLLVEYIIAYLASAHFGALQQWLENGLKESP